jgi:hypothetical protein
MGRRRRKYALKRAREVRVAGKTVCTPKGFTPEKLKTGVLVEEIMQIRHEQSPITRFLRSRGKNAEYQQTNLSEQYPKATVALMEAKGLIKEPAPQCQPQQKQKGAQDLEVSTMPFVLPEFLRPNSES